MQEILKETLLHEKKKGKIHKNLSKGINKQTESKIAIQGFPGGAVVENACQCRGHGFEPWSGKIPHAVEQLGP